jgi:hypothetical protein
MISSLASKMSLLLIVNFLWDIKKFTPWQKKKKDLDKKVNNTYWEFRKDIEILKKKKKTEVLEMKNSITDKKHNGKHHQ